MKKKKFCELCGYEIIDKIICDTCGKIVPNYYEIGKITRIELNLSGTDYHFDSLQCLFRFVFEELKKESKELNQDLDTQNGEQGK